MADRAGAKAAFAAALFADDEPCRAYAVLDGASVPGLAGHLDRLGSRYECLFTGRLDPAVAAVAPYVVELEPESRCLDWWLGEGWGGHWGVGLRARPDLQFSAVRRHLRTFSRVRGPDGHYQLFRFYDPRALAKVMPSMGSELVAIMFKGIVMEYLAELPPGSVIRYRAGRDAVITETLA